MSNIKHLPDILRVCSVLPALVVMPAMADVIEKTGSVDEPANFISQLNGTDVLQDTSANGLIRVLNMTEGSYSFDEEKNFMTVTPSKDGKITAQNLFVGIQNQPSDALAPTLCVQGDENTVLTLTSEKSGVYPLVSRFAKLNIGTENQSLGEVNLTHTNGGAAIYITDAVTGDNKTGQGHVGNQELNIFANKVSIEATGTAITGNEGKLNLVANEALNITGDINGYNDVYGGKAHMTMNINQNAGNTAKTTIVGNIGAAQGSAVNIGLKGEGSSITGDILVSANGEKLPGGGINLGFGDAGTITGNITAQDQGVVKITADDDFAINGKVFATATGSWIDIQGDEIAVTSETDGVLASKGAIINVGTKDTDVIKIVSTADGRGVRADYASTLNIGDADTDTVDITTGDNYAVMGMYANSKVNIKGKNINLANSSSGAGVIHAGTSGIEENHDYATSPIVNIHGKNIVITNDAISGVGIGAMSQGVVNVEGNTTINAESVILARGESRVNVNQSGKHTVKMDGNIDFNYKYLTSNSPVNANVNVTLAGADSLWTGNTIVSWDDVMPDKEKLVVSNSKLTMTNGAVWNASVIEDKETAENGRRYTALNDLVINKGTVNIADTDRGIYVDRVIAGGAIFNGGALNINESFVANGTISGDGTLTLAKDATMDIGSFLVNVDTANINGTVIASAVSARSHGRLWSENLTFGEDAVLKLNIGSVGTYDILGGNKKYGVDILVGDTYIATETDRGIVIETKSVADIAKDAGLTVETAGTVANLANSVDGNLQKLSLLAQQALNSGNSALVEKETAKLAPEDENMTRSVAMSAQSQALSLASGRMNGGMGRAGGDKSQTNGFWAQGLFNKTKYADQFHGYSRGFAVGADTTIDRKYTIGAGLTHTNSDVHSGGRHTDISTTTLFAYGQYKPTDWFLNGTLVYAMSEYDENIDPFGVQINSLYNANSFGAQAMTGYALKSGLTPQVGIRYLHIEQDEYNNGVNRMNAMDYEYLSGVAGFAYSFNINNARSALQLKPELRAMLTYDLVQDNSVATVVMNNINSSYIVDGENLSRVGGEFGVGLTATYNGVDVSVMYDITLHEDYTSQTGMIKFRGQF